MFFNRLEEYGHQNTGQRVAPVCGSELQCYFGPHRLASTLVEISALRMEIEAQAVRLV